jgi:hypothetical protein
VLLRLLVDGRISGPEFEVVFLPLYKQDSTVWPSEFFDVLDSFFADVDRFCEDPLLRAQVDGIDESQLRELAAKTLERLSALATTAP